MRLRPALRAFVLLNLAPMGRRKARALLAVIAISAGVALLSGVFTAERSTTASIDAVARTMAGPTALRVSGPTSHGGLTESVVTTIRAVPGVAAGVPVVQAVAQVQSPHGKYLVLALGVDCSAQAIVGDFGCSPAMLRNARPGTPPAVSGRLLQLLGGGASVRTDLGTIPLTAQSKLTQLDRVNDGRVVVFPLQQAQAEFVRPGAVDTAYVVPAAHVSVDELRTRLKQALPVQEQVFTADEAPPFFDTAGLLLPLMGLIGLMSLGVGALILFNIVSLTAAERRRELAIAHALGARGSVVVRGALAEASLLGLAGGALGAAAGIVVAVPLVHKLAEQVVMFTGVHLRVHVVPVLFVLGPLLGVVTAVAAAWLPARRAMRVDVARELHARAALDLPSRARAVRGAVVMLATAGVGLAACLIAGRHYALASWQPPLGTVGLLLTMAGSIGATVVLAPAVVRMLLPWARRRSGVPAVAIRMLAAEPRRTGIAATAVAVPVAFASILAAAIPAIDGVTVHLFSGVIGNRVYVSPLNSNNTLSIDAKASPALMAALRRMPDVAAVDRGVFVTTPVGGRRTVVSARDEDPLPFRVIDGVASPAALARGEVLVGPALARAEHLHPGSMVTVDGLHERVRLRVAGIWGDPDNVGAAMTMNLHRLESLLGPQPPSELFVRPRPGVSTDRLASEIKAAHLDSDLVVQAPPAFLRSLQHDVAGLLAPFWTLQDALLVVALIGTLSTLLLVGVQRRQELGTLAALGLSPGRLARMTVMEAALVGAAGAALGILAGLVSGAAMLADSIFVAGASPPFGFDFPATGRYVAIALVVVLVGASWPAWRTSRLEVVEALRAE